MYSLRTPSSSVGAWAAGLLMVCLPIRMYILHGGMVLGADVIDPVYGTAYVGAVLTLVASALLVRGERDVTEQVTGNVLATPLRAFGVGVLALAALGAFGVGSIAAIEGLSLLAAATGFLPVHLLLFLCALVLLAATISLAVYAAATLLFGIVFGYLALGRAIVGPHGWPPVIIAGAVLANVLAFVPAASLVVELVLAAVAVGGLVLAARESPQVDPAMPADPSTQ